MRTLLIVGITVVLIAAAGCSGGDTPIIATTGAALDPRPAGAPDFVVLHVSGRTTGVNLTCPPACNQPYLADPDEAPGAIAQDLVALGFSVDTSAYIAALQSFDDDNNGTPDRHGFLQLVADMQRIFDDWMDGISNPTRIVLVGHSHGAVWAHIATGVMPHVPVEVLVSLDGVCFFWELDHTTSVQDFYATNGGNPWSFDVSDSCDFWIVPGVAAPADTEDVVFPNVGFNLEVRSNGADVLGISDLQLNRRPDGSNAGVLTFDSTQDDHSAVHHVGTESVAWVRARLIERVTAP